MNKEVLDAVDYLESIAKQFEAGGYTRVRYVLDPTYVMILLRKGYAEVSLQAITTQKHYEETK